MQAFHRGRHHDAGDMHATGVRGIECRSAGRGGRQSRRSDIERWRARRGERPRLHATGVRGIERRSARREGRQSRRSDIERWRARRGERPRLHATGVRGIERRSARREGRQSRRSDIEDGAPGGVRSRACTPLACAASNAAAPGAKAGNHDEATSKDGAPGGIRTPDQWLRKPLLYPAELRARCVSLREPGAPHRPALPGGGAF